MCGRSDFFLAGKSWKDVTASTKRKKKKNQMNDAFTSGIDREFHGLEQT